jgi:hypothetical protein
MVWAMPTGGPCLRCADLPGAVAVSVQMVLLVCASPPGASPESPCASLSDVSPVLPPVVFTGLGPPAPGVPCMWWPKTVALAADPECTVRHGGWFLCPWPMLRVLRRLGDVTPQRAMPAAGTPQGCWSVGAQPAGSALCSGGQHIYSVAALGCAETRGAPSAPSESSDTCEVVARADCLSTAAFLRKQPPSS